MPFFLILKLYNYSRSRDCNNWSNPSRSSSSKYVFPFKFFPCFENLSSLERRLNKTLLETCTSALPPQVIHHSTIIRLRNEIFPTYTRVYLKLIAEEEGTCLLNRVCDVTKKFRNRRNCHLLLKYGTFLFLCWLFFCFKTNIRDALET